MSLTIGQLIAKMSYQGLNKYAGNIDWNNAPQALVGAVWQRYEALIDSLDGTEAPFATPGFWNRMLGEEALEIERECIQNRGSEGTQPEEPTQDVQPDMQPGPSNQPTADDEESTDEEEEDEEIEEVDVIGEEEADGTQIGGSLEDHIEMREIENILVRRFGTQARGYEITFRNLDAINNLHALLQRAIELAVQRTTRDARPNDLIGVQITAPGMRKPVLLPFRPKEQIDVEKIMHLLDSVAQSNTNVKVDENMAIRVTRVCPPRAGGKKKAPPFKSNMAAHLESFERAVVKIENTDMLCIPRAIVTGMA